MEPRMTSGTSGFTLGRCRICNRQFQTATIPLRRHGRIRTGSALNLWTNICVRCGDANDLPQEWGGHNWCCNAVESSISTEGAPDVE